jgi:hypothetical protein
MLEFTLLAGDNENYNIIDWGSDGDNRSRPPSPYSHFRRPGLDFPDLLGGARCWS